MDVHMATPLILIQLCWASRAEEDDEDMKQRYTPGPFFLFGYFVNASLNTVSWRLYNNTRCMYQIDFTFLKLQTPHLRDRQNWELKRLAQQLIFLRKEKFLFLSDPDLAHYSPADLQSLNLS